LATKQTNVEQLFCHFFKWNNSDP